MRGRERLPGNTQIRLAVVFAASVLLLACGRLSSMHSEVPPVKHPQRADILSEKLTAQSFINGKFVAYTDVWGVWSHEGDPIVFHVDGTVDNARAGLQGTWKLIDETTVLVANRTFKYAIEKHCLFSPLEPEGDVGWYIILEQAKQEWLKYLTKSR